MTVGSFIKKSLITTGSFALIFLVSFYVLVFYQLSNNGPGTLDQDDMEFRLVEDLFVGSTLVMLESYSESGSWAGDNEKAFSARVAGLDAANIARMVGVIRGDQLTPTLDSALEFVTDLLGAGQLAWFPTREEVLSSGYYVYLMQLDLIGEYPDSASLLIIRPMDGMAFYGHVKI